MSKIKLVWAFITGGREKLLDCVLDEVNRCVASIDDATKEQAAEYLDILRKLLKTLSSVDWAVPDKWQEAYQMTLDALADTISAVEDGELTRAEIGYVSQAWTIAYSKWRA